MPEESNNLLEQENSLVPTNTGGDKYYIVYIPDIGDYTIKSFSNKDLFLKELYESLSLIEYKMFKGEVIPFRGSLVDYSNAVPAFRVKIESDKEVEVKDENNFKFLSSEVIEE